VAALITCQRKFAFGLDARVIWLSKLVPAAAKAGCQPELPALVDRRDFNVGYLTRRDYCEVRAHGE
jgi:hypothetical protein